eukprot:scaffold348_cov151-Skeletonema_dohrnii-CCMP3373.AAC.9
MMSTLLSSYLLLLVLVAPSQCLLTHPTTTNNRQNLQYRKAIIQPLSFSSRANSASAARSPNSNKNTALHLFFDNFLHPYGVSPNNHTNGDDDDDIIHNYNYFGRKSNKNKKGSNKKKEEDENYLLSLLLPKYRTPEELKSQSVEEFQRARLEQQLRVMRNEKQKMMEEDERKGGKNDMERKNTNKEDDNKVFMADDDDMVKRVADMFQRNRLEEQHKLRARQQQQQQQSSRGTQGQLDQPQEAQQQQTMNALESNTKSDDKKHFLITNEAFQRALLEERLRQSQQQQQQKKQEMQERFVIDMEAMEQDKNDILHLIEATSASSATSKTTDTVEKRDDDDLTNDGDIEKETENVDGGSSDNVEASTVNDSGASNDSGPPVNNDKVMTTDRDGDGGGGDNAGYVMPINGDSGGESATKATTMPSDLSTQLKILHRMVALATAPVPPPPSASTAITLLASNETATSSSRSPMRIQKFLATTHLPLPPDETTPITSLALTPLAHIATSIFLSGAALFYATLAILDILLNDGKEEYCAKTCMRKAVSIWKCSWHYLFAKQQMQQQHRGALYRTMEAAQTSFLALFFTCQCVIVRAATRTRYATECMDAGLGSLRCLIYATRSLSFLWKRVVSSLRQRIGNIRSSSAVTSNTGIKKERRKFHLLRVLSNIRNSASRRINHQRSLLIKQQRMRAEKEFQDKVQSLNEDILAVEREKKKLDMDRANLLSEGVGVLAWYSMTKEASDALAAEREELEKERRRKGGGKRHWRPRFGYWGVSGDDDSYSEDDENVEIDNNVTDADN